MTELEALRRAVQSNPDDAAARRRYELALSRAGRADELEASLAFRFRCEKTWEELSETPSPDPRERFCGDCARAVHFTTDIAEIAWHAASAGCIAAPPEVLTAYLRAHAPQLLDPDAAAPTCLVAGPDEVSQRAAIPGGPMAFPEPPEPLMGSMPPPRVERLELDPRAPPNPIREGLRAPEPDDCEG